MRTRPAKPIAWGVAVIVVAAACSESAADEAASAATASTVTAFSSTVPATPSTVPTTTAPAANTTVVPPPATAPASTAPASTAPETSAPTADDGYPDQPPGVPWPTEEWAVGEPPSGVDVAAIDGAVEAALGADDAEARLRSFLVVHGGQIVYERYHPRDDADTVFSSFSVAKSVTATLIGMLADDGLVEVTAPAPVEEWSAPDDPRAAITLEHLLQMRSGLTWEEAYGPDDVAGRMFASPDWAAYVIDQPLESEPGDLFEYSTGTTAVLAEIAADRLGGPDALDRFIETELLDPLGIESTQLIQDPTGQFVGGLGFDATARDFARFGLMVVRGGGWDGEQIVSSEWLDLATTPSPALGAYGYQWWLDPRGEWFAARGLFGQLILIAPGLDLVIVATTTNGGDSETPAMVALGEFRAALG